MIKRLPFLLFLLTFSSHQMLWGQCQGTVNINCPQGANWQVQKNAVAKVFDPNGNWTCTGTLVNNSSADGRALFLTARHCLLDYAEVGQSYDLEFRWGHEMSACTGGTEVQGFYTTGATVLASSGSLDFILYEIDLSALQGTTFTPYYAGWDASGENTGTGAFIHHPADLTKKIAPILDMKTTTHSCPGEPWSVPEAPAGKFWHILLDNDEAVFQGSSGSPMFGAHGRVMGTMVGCSNLDCTPTAVKLVHSYNGLGGEDALSEFLNPEGAEITYLPGMDPACPISVFIEMICEAGPTGQCDLQAYAMGHEGPFQYSWGASVTPIEGVNDYWDDICGTNTYSVTITDGNGCTATYEQTFTANVACSEPGFPPTRGMLAPSGTTVNLSGTEMVLDFPPVQEAVEVEIVLYDLLGRVNSRQSYLLSPGQITLSHAVKNLGKGIHFVGILDDEGRLLETHKVLVR